MSLSPSANVYLRNSLDTDPSDYLGRFIPEGVHDLDESNSMTLACSRLISYRFIDGGGVRYDELLNVSSAVGARIGVPLIASGSVKNTSKKVVRVSYELTGKLVASIKDPQAFASCCKQQPDQCTGRYVGEFVQGVGAIYHESASATEAEARGVVPTSGVSGGAELSRGVSWERAVEFPKPVYFAFKVAATGYQQQSTSACAGWESKLPPTPDGGSWVTGSSKPAKSESGARNRALLNATMQAAISQGAAAAETGVTGLRADDWCIETLQTKKGTRYKAKVRAFVPTPPPPSAQPERHNAADDYGPADDYDPADDYGPDEGFGQPAPPIPSRTPRARPTARPAPSAAAAAGPAISGLELSNLLDALDDASFSSDKLNVVRTAAAQQNFRCDQVTQILANLSFSSDQIKALRALRPAIVDPENGAIVVDSFTFRADQNKARMIFQ